MATDTGTDELSDTAGGEHNRLKTLGKYRIERRIGAGGMGTVFLAVDESLNRTVALKVLPRDRAENPVLVRRFKAEGQAAAHMEHPNIVRVFEAGEADGYLYMALEYVEGIDVHELVERRGVIPVKRSADIIRQTALALQHAYEKGIVHRDIKPANLLINREGSVKLADMGLARSIDETLETNITRAGTTVGTVDFMSPEQARNSKAADVRSDIYSLGCTWYHMLTGHPPFHEGSMTNKLQAHAVSTRPDPRAENDHVPEGIVAIIQRMMAVKPDDRHQTPQELLDDLVAVGKLHRNVDESALAALASESADIEEAEEVDEPDLRMSDDVDEIDLALLRDSGEYEVETPAAKPREVQSRSKPKPPDKPRQRRPAGAPRTVEEKMADEGNGADEERTVEEPYSRRRPTKGDSAQTVPEQPESERPSRRSPAPPDASDPQTPTRKSKPQSNKSKPNKSKSKKTPKQEAPSPTTGRQRRTKQGTVTTSGGQAPALPSKDASQPVDGSTKPGINLEALKFLIPAVLVVAALGAAGFAILRSGDSLSMGGANPYAGSQPDDAPSVETDEPQPTPEPDPDPSPPAAEPPPQVAAVPFPGAEDVTESSDQKPLIPEWVNAFRTPSGRAEQTLIVRRRPVGDGAVGTINAALDKLPGGGGTIEIDGDGPFPLDAVNVSNIGHVRLQAADGRRPVIQLLAPADWKSGSLLKFRGTRVEMEGLHFVLVDSGYDGAAVIDVVGGDVSLRNCSITVDHTIAVDPKKPVSMTALRIEGTAGSLSGAATGRCLLENVVIRGSGVTSIALQGPSADLVAGNCLLVSGNAPAITVTDTGGGVTTSGIDPPTRGLRLLATTVVSSRSAFALTHQPGSGDVVPTELITRQSLLVMSAADGSHEAAAMAVLRGWPAGTGGLGESRVKDLTWQAEQSGFVGWSNLLTFADDAGQPLANVAASSVEWGKFWSKGLRSDTVIAETVATGPFALAAPGAVHAELASIAQPMMKDGQLPGCRPDGFSPLPGGLIAHVVAVSRQPYEPKFLGANMPVKGDPVRFDLSKRRTLSSFLSSDACADGTHVIAFGSGLKELEPIVIEGKSVRLEFESTGKSSLVLRPKATREGAAAPEALITVRNGTLDLINARLKMTVSRKWTYPKSAILLDDASLSLRACSVEGPRLEAQSMSPLIRCIGEGKPSSQRAILIENSFLVSLAPLLSGPVRWQSLIVRNTVLVSGGNAISVGVTTAEQLPSAIVLDHSTIMAAGAAIRADVAAATAAESDRLSLFARASVFAGPIDADGQQSAVVAHSAGAAQNHSLTWWGSANGYSSRLAGFRIDGTSGPGDFGQDWQAAWGDGHEANPLTGAADVLFADSLPDVLDVEPTSLRLADSATASSWGPAGEPIGAQLDEIGPDRQQGGAAKPKKGTTPRMTPGKRDPGF